MTRTAAAVTIVITMTLSGVAWAEGGTSDDACGYASFNTNIPNGALVLSRGSDGIITPVIDAIQEYYTHSMISHGNGWFSHSTMYTPGIDYWDGFWSGEWIEEDQLQRGYPGFSQTTTAGLAHYLLGSQAIRYFNGNAHGVATTNWAWSAPWKSMTSEDNSNYHIYQIGIAYTGDDTTWHGAMPYVLYQYKDVQGRHLGGWSQDNGAVCSTSIAYSVNMAAAVVNEYNNNNSGNCPSYYYDDGWCDRGCQFADIDCTDGGAEYVAAKTYPNWMVKNAAQALYDGMYAKCQDESPFSSICDNMGDQIANCMASGDCDTDSSSLWRNIVNSGQTATSVSPDRLHESYSGSRSPWAGATPNAVTASSGGSVYGCWF